MNIPIFRSLRFKMPLVVLSGVIPLVLIAIFYASERATKKIRQEARENMALKAELLAESVNRWDELNAKAVINLSKQPGIVSLDPQSQEAVLKNTIDTYDHFYLAMTTDLEGWNVARSDEPKKVFFGDRDWFLGAKAGNELTYQTLIGRTTKRLALCLSAPIGGNVQVEIVGVSVACTDLGDIVKQVGELKFGDTGYAILVDESGTVLAHPDPDFVSGKKLKDLSSYPPVKYLLSGGRGHLSFQDYQGNKWVSYDVPLKNNWGIIAVQRADEFLQSEQDFQNLAFLIAGVSVLAVSILTWFLANRLIDPISNLTNAASALSEGKLDRRVITKRKDELGILANSFNSMAERLTSFFNNLEQQIEQRTAQLKEAKEAAEHAKDNAEAANKSKDRFLANISHELRTPLNSILGYTKIILSDPKLDPDHFKDLKTVEKSGNHLLNLINDVLDFSKTQAEKMELYPTSLDLAKFLRELIDLVKMWAKEKNLEIKGEWHNLPNIIEVDETRLRQVLINLLSNAIKFTKQGTIILKIKTVNRINNNNSIQQTLRFEIIDTGVGMSHEELSTIFKPFEQVGDIKSRAAGTGLGLSISSQLVQLMGGQLKVKSTLGIGSIFWFDLTVPVVEITKKNNPQQQSNGKISGYQGKSRKILVVDDREENRLLLVKMLQPKGFEIATANNGHVMIESARSFKPDLILMDLFMPEKTGFTAAKEIRQIPELKHTPIVVVTASSITKETGSYLQAEAILHKPIDQAELFATLEEHLKIKWTYQAKTQPKAV